MKLCITHIDFYLLHVVGIRPLSYQLSGRCDSIDETGAIAEFDPISITKKDSNSGNEGFFVM